VKFFSDKLVEKTICVLNVGGGRSIQGKILARTDPTIQEPAIAAAETH